MTRTNILQFVMIFSAVSASGQEPIWTKQANISAVISFEKGINPNPKFLTQNESLSKEYYPLAYKYQVTNPVIVQREPLYYLPLYAEYFYTPGDSILRLVSYDWEKDRYGNFFDKQKMWKGESEKFDVYNKEYERIRTSLLALLGKSASTDTKAKEIGSDEKKYFTRETLWVTDEINAKLTMVFASTTYRIRLTLYSTK